MSVYILFKFVLVMDIFTFTDSSGNYPLSKMSTDLAGLCRNKIFLTMIAVAFGSSTLGFHCGLVHVFMEI